MNPEPRPYPSTTFNIDNPGPKEGESAYPELSLAVTILLAAFIGH
jgi:hypothetical protein